MRRVLGWSEVLALTSRIVLVLAAALMHAQSAQGQRPVKSCTNRTWKPLTALALPNKVLRWPQLAPMKDGLILLGNNAVSMGPEPPPGQLFVAVRSSGTPIELPPGDFQFILPKVGVDSKDRLHMVWGEGGAKLRRSDELMSPRITSLWYSSFSSGIWSPPILIHTAEIIRWHAANASLAIDSASNVHIAFVAYSARGPGVIHAHTKAGSWHSEPALNFPPSYMHLATAGPNVFLAAVANDNTSPGDLNSVFATRSLQGKPWDERVRIQLSGNRPAMDAWVFYGNDRALHLIWLQSLEGGLSAGAIRHALSSDQGKTWSFGADFPIPGDPNNSVALMDHCGRIHVVLEIASLPDYRPQLFYARWEGRWVSEELPGGASLAFGPAMGASPNGSVFVGWNTAAYTPALGRTEHHYKMVEFGGK